VQTEMVDLQKWYARPDHILEENVHYGETDLWRNWEFKCSGTRH